MSKLPDFGPLVWNLAFAASLRSSGDVGAAWAEADEAWTRLRERQAAPAKAPGRPHPNVKRRKK